jgi:hypothetical protein
MRVSSALLTLVACTASGRNVPLNSNMKALHLDIQGESSCPSVLISYCCYELDYDGDQVECIGTSNLKAHSLLLKLTIESLKAQGKLTAWKSVSTITRDQCVVAALRKA